MNDHEQCAPGPLLGAQLRKARFEAHGTLGRVGSTVKLTTWGASATHPRLDRVEDHLERRAPTELLDRFAGVRSLYG